MTFIRTIPAAEATGRLAELYRRYAESDGTVDEAYTALSLHPDLLAADAALYQTTMHADSPLSRLERELLALTVSRLNGCMRCLRHHGRRHEELQHEEESRQAPTLEEIGRRAALIAFAERLTLTPAAVTVADIDVLRQAGLTDRMILDACNVVAYFNYANRITLALGLDADPGTSATHPDPGLHLIS